MNKKILFFSILSIILFLFASCNDDDKDIQPTDISNTRAEVRNGAVMLRWDVPSDSNYYYVKVTYHDPWIKKDIIKLSSVYTDSLYIKNMLNRFGDYKFTLQPYSRSMTPGNPHEVIAKCDPFIQTVNVIAKEVTLTADDISTNALQENDGGGIPALIDRKSDTFFHSAWSWNPGEYHYIQIALKEPLNGTHFRFKYQNRNNTNGKPKQFIIRGSKDGSDFSKILAEVGSAQGIDLPEDGGSEYTSEDFELTGDTADMKYFRFVVTKTNGSGTYPFFNMAEFWFYDVEYVVYDPENDLDAEPVK